MASGIGSAPGILIGFGVGAAASAALEPAFEVPRQEAWKRNPNRVLDPGILARLVAEGGVPLGEARDEAERHGYAADKFDRMVWAAQNVPGTAELLFLWRLGLIDRAKWKEGMVKLGQRPDFIDYVARTYAVPLTAEEVAVAIHRSVILNQGQLPDLPPVGPGKILRYPEVPIDAYKSAEAYGVGNDQLDALTRVLGLPPGMDLVARMVFRGVLDRNDFDLAAAQSNRRREWAPAEFEGYRQIPTAHEYTEGHLRGYTTQAEMYAGTAKHGMSKEDTDLLYANAGRPLNIHQVTTGLARGGKYGGGYDAVPAGPYRDAILRGPLRPEYADLDYANRYNYPSAFVLRSLAQAGTLGGAAEVQQVLEEIGWKPSFAKQVAADWTGSTGGDSHIGKAQTQLWGTTHRSYIAEEIDDATATASLTAAGVDPASIPHVLALWQTERDMIRKQLSPAQIKKAVTEGVTNPATSAPWTQADGLAALLARGYDHAAAATLLIE